MSKRPRMEAKKDVLATRSACPNEHTKERFQEILSGPGSFAMS